jgi:hypothetical protein
MSKPSDLSLQLDKLINLHGAENVIDSLTDALALKAVQAQLSADKWDCEGYANYADSDRISADNYERLCAGFSEFADTADYSGVN